jgi:hypothetical protein
MEINEKRMPMEMAWQIKIDKGVDINKIVGWSQIKLLIW